MEPLILSKLGAKQHCLCDVGVVTPDSEGNIAQLQGPGKLELMSEDLFFQAHFPRKTHTLPC